MSEEIGVLRIDLTLDNADFQKSMQQIDTKLKGLNSEFKASKSGVEGYEKTLEGLRTKQDNLSKTLDLQKTKVSKLKSEYDRIAEAQGANSVEAEKMLTKYNNAVAAMKKTETQLDKTTRAIKEQENPWKRVEVAAKDYETTLQNLSTKMSDFGQKAKELGGNLSLGVTTPLAALGATAGNTAIQFDNASAQIQTSLGVTAQEAEKLQKSAKAIWSDGFGDSLASVTDSLIKVKQNMKLVAEGAELEKVTRDAMLLAQRFESDVNEVTRAGNNLMVNFGIESEKAFDLMAWGAQNGLNFSQEMFDNLSEYSGLFAAMGYTAEEYFAILTRGSEAGVYNLDYLNDIMKEFQIRLKDGSDTTSEAMGTLSQKTLDLWEAQYQGKATVAEVAESVVNDLKSMENQVDANQIGVALFGTKWEDLESKAVYAMLGTSEAIEGTTGTMNRLAEAQDKTFSQEWTETVRETQDALLPLGETLLDIANNHLPKIKNGIKELTGWFNELSPSAQDATLAVGGAAAVAGPLLVGFGLASQGIAALIKMGTPLINLLKSLGPSAAGGSAATGINGIGSALGPATVGLGLFAGSATLLSSKWDELLKKQPAFLATLSSFQPQLVGAAWAMDMIRDNTGSALETVNVFGEGVSEATQKAVGGFLELESQAITSLNQLAWGGAEITQEMATKLIGIYDQMGQQVLTEMQADHQEQLTSMQEHFANSKALTEQEEEEIIVAMQMKQQAKEKNVEEGNKRITEILNNAAKEKRAITEAEQQEINDIQKTMTENAIEYLTGSEREQKFIYENLKRNASELTAQQASEVIKNSNEQKQQMIKDAEEQHKQTVMEIEKQRDEMGTITAEQADKLIAEADRQLKETKSKAEEMHSKVVEEAQKQAKEHVDKVNWETGEVLSKWDVFKGQLGKKTGEIITDMKRNWDKSLQTTTAVWNSIAAWPGKKIDEMKTSVATKMKEVESKIETGWNEAQAFLSSIDLTQIGRDIINGLINGIAEKADTVKTKIEQLAGLIPEWAKDILGIHSPSRVFMRIGEYVVQGLQKGLEDGEEDLNKAAVEMAEAIIPDISPRTKEAKEELTKFKKEVYQAITDINKEYYTKVQELNRNLLQEEQRLNEEYEKAVNDRAKALYNFTSLFEEYINRAVDGNVLTENLESQVNAFEDWQNKITKLSQRAIDEGLLEELREMGPDALGEIAALNRMTDQELDYYVELWRKKTKLAKEQALKEMSGMKQANADTIAQLRAETEQKLLEYQKVWQNSFLEMVEKLEFTSKEMIGLGENIADGMIKGIESQEKNLINIAKKMASTITSTVKKELDIHSPSREFIKIGKFVVQGLSEGIDRNKTLAVSSARQMAQEVIATAKNIAKEINSIGFSEGDYLTYKTVAKNAIDENDYNSFDEYIEHFEGYVERKKELGQMSVEQEKMFWQAVADSFGKYADSKSFPKYTKVYEEALNRINDLTEDINKNNFEATKDWLDKTLLYEDLSLADQLELYQTFLNSYEQYTDEHAYFYEKLVDTKEKIAEEELRLAEEQAEALEELYDNTVSSLDELGSALQDALSNKYEVELDLELSYSDNLYDGLITPLEKAREELQKQKELLQQQFEQEDQQTKMSDLRSSLANARTEADRKRIQKLIADEEKAQRRKQQEQVLESEVDNIDSRIEALKKEKDAAAKAIEEKYKAMTSQEAIEHEARKLILENNEEEIIKLLKSYNPDWQDVGQSFGEKLIYGLNSMKTPIQKAVDNIMDMMSIALATLNSNVGINVNGASNLSFGAQAFTVPSIPNINISSQPIVLEANIDLDGERVATQTFNYTNNLMGQSASNSMRWAGVKG